VALRGCGRALATALGLSTASISFPKFGRKRGASSLVHFPTFCSKGILRYTIRKTKKIACIIWLVHCTGSFSDMAYPLR
jgi:hypothetical protein